MAVDETCLLWGVLSRSHFGGSGKGFGAHKPYGTASEQSNALPIRKPV
jgi:hypothetical protein